MSKASLKETQQALAQAVRLGNTTPLGDYAPNRLAVYARLVRNNTLGFIDRCYVEAPKHIPSDDWAEIKEKFIREGKAKSPYFQDIAGEFLDFCQENQLLNEAVLALMDFEYTQLLAEVSMFNVPERFEWDEETVMQCSGCAFLKEYVVDFLSSEFNQIDTQPSQLIVWRDSHFGVYHQLLTALDFWLLTYLSEQPDSLTGILQALNEVTTESETLKPLLQQAWIKWIAADVIVPINVE